MKNKKIKINEEVVDKELDTIIESLVKEAKDSRDEDVENDAVGYFDDFVMDWAESVGLAITKEEFDEMFGE